MTLRVEETNDRRGRMLIARLNVNFGTQDDDNIPMY